MGVSKDFTSIGRGLIPIQNSDKKNDTEEGKEEEKQNKKLIPRPYVLDQIIPDEARL